MRPLFDKLWAAKLMFFSNHFFVDHFFSLMLLNDFKRVDLEKLLRKEFDQQIYFKTNLLRNNVLRKNKLYNYKVWIREVQ